MIEPELRVSDLKQYYYCPRVVYYQYVVPVDHAVTYKMEKGRAAQDVLEPLEARRKLKAYGLGEGKRNYCRDIWLGGKSLPTNKSNKIDLTIDGESRTREGSPVRCPWVDLTKPDYVAYHDREWGVPVRDDRLLFELLVLESAQAGLSWYTVLRKREAYREAFDGFDPEKVARYDEARIEKLLQNSGIIRNRRKIQAAVNNARRFLSIQEELGSFSDYMWGFVDGRPIVNEIRVLSDYPATSPESDVMSRDLRKRGFQFVGSTICYAHMQATGMVNDHSLECFRRPEIMEGYPEPAGWPPPGPSCRRASSAGA